MKGKVHSESLLLQRPPKILGLDETLFFYSALVVLTLPVAFPKGIVGLLVTLVLAVAQHGVLIRMSRHDPKAPLKLARFAFAQRRFYGYPRHEELLPWLASRLFSSV